MSCRDEELKQKLIQSNKELADHYKNELGRPDVYPKDILWLRMEYSMESDQDEFLEFCKDVIHEEVKDGTL